MQNLTIEFPYNSRITYFAIKNLFRKHTGFTSLISDDSLYIIKARRGALLSPFSESIKVDVIATSANSCKVNLQSSSRSILNILNINANKDNVSTLSGYISNEVYKLMNPGEIPITNQHQNKSEIRIIPPDIKFK